MSENEQVRWAGTDAGVADRRQNARVPIEGEALWRLGDREGKAKNRNLSVGGIEIEFDQQPLPDVGTTLELILQIRSHVFVGISARVAHASSGKLGLKLDRIQNDFLQDLMDLVEDALIEVDRAN